MSDVSITRVVMSDTQKRLIEKLRREFGQQIITALEDPDTIEIMLNCDGSLWVEKMGHPMVCLGVPNINPKAFIGTTASFIDTAVTPENPILECELPIDGSRFEALIPPVVAKPAFAIRKKASKVFTLDEYEEQGIFEPAAADEECANNRKIPIPENLNRREIIEFSIKHRKNILIVGGTGSGKTTFTNAIIDAIVKINSDHRLVIIEDTAEVQCAAKNKLILRATDKVSMLQLLKATMRLRPDRIIVGEVRGDAALDMLNAWNTGHPGGIATCHADSAKLGLTRLEQMIPASIAPVGLKEIIADAVDLVVYMEKTKSGRKIKEVIEVTGFDPVTKQYIINTH